MENFVAFGWTILLGTNIDIGMSAAVATLVPNVRKEVVYFRLAHSTT